MKTFSRMLIALLFAAVFVITTSAQSIVAGVHRADAQFAIAVAKKFAPPPKLELPKRLSVQPLSLHSGFQDGGMRYNGVTRQFIIVPPSSFDDTNPALLALAHRGRSHLKRAFIIGGIAAIGITMGVSIVHHH